MCVGRSACCGFDAAKGLIIAAAGLRPHALRFLGWIAATVAGSRSKRGAHSFKWRTRSKFSVCEGSRVIDDLDISYPHSTAVERLGAIADWADTGVLRPVVAQVFPFDSAIA
jgi:NADPH:quinone reductase-like Zn-dependent oxidoreductase